MSRRKKIVFIGGYGRSGSTLLDRVLGHCSESFFSGGEIRHIWREGYGENRLCGCGRPFRDCEFWTSVSRRAFGGMYELNVSRLLETKDRVDRWWLIPKLASRSPGLRFAADLGGYQHHLRRLYDGIIDESGCDVIIDSTKDPSHGFVLSTMADVELHVVHLVRDSRAVAHSWLRQKYNPGSGSDMNRYSLLKTGLEWNAINTLVSGLRRRATGYTVVHYEDLVADPRTHLARVLDTIGESGELPVDGRLDLEEDHTVAGNPIRFRRGETQLRLDDEWREAMPPASKLAMTSLTLPTLARYGFKTSWAS
jgi:hypothetical protein